MQEYFEEVINMSEVLGVMLLGLDGSIQFHKFTGRITADPTKVDWLPQMLQGMQELTEAEFIYQKARLYVRHSKHGFLFVWAESSADMSRVRLNCDVVLNNWEKAAAASDKSKRGFFRR